ncbi:MAG TPA: LacI family DNA-binding transcriptional regulator [Xanthomonadales bacterium]|nr:LacI family DNA-binding transcriptional regulator [Xanthomonadales bacterium]
MPSRMKKPPSGKPKGAAATINDIARLAGVSKKTVSRVLNRSPLVRAETRDKVAALMREHDYVPDPQARALAFRRSFLIGMVYDNPNAQYIVNMQNGALESLRGSGYELVVHPCDSRGADYVAGVREFVKQQRLHGVILVPRVSEDQALVDMLADVGCRYARIAAVSLDSPDRMIATNDRQGATEAANYLESLGHRTIALVTGPMRYLSARERSAGFVDALAKRGLKVPPARIVEGGYTFESGVAAAEKLLALKPRPTAIFALNDEMAAGVFKTAQRMGIAVPEQLSIVGFDDSPLASRLWPSLTSVRLPIREMGMNAAALLLDEHPLKSAPLVTPHLVVRESCAPPA